MYLPHVLKGEYCALVYGLNTFNAVQVRLHCLSAINTTGSRHDNSRKKHCLPISLLAGSNSLREVIWPHCIDDSSYASSSFTSSAAGGAGEAAFGGPAPAFGGGGGNPAALGLGVEPPPSISRLFCSPSAK